MYLTTSLLVLSAALGASAAPSPGHGHGHAHMHRHAHEVRQAAPESSVMVTAVIDGKTVEWLQGEGPWVQAVRPTPTSTSTPPPPPTTTSTTSTSTSTVPPPTTTSAAAASTVASPAAASSSASSSGAQAFCSGASVRKRATAAEINYTGNVGTASDYACNMMLVDSASDYDYTMAITNSQSVSQSCACWLKIGPSGEVNGFWYTPLSWTLAAGETQVVAFESNSQGACGCNPGSSLLKTPAGQNAPTYIEYDFDNTSNGGWSGSDCSSLVAVANDMEITPCEVCFDGTCSQIKSDGSGTNAFTAGTANDNGLGINAAPGVVHLIATV